MKLHDITDLAISCRESDVRFDGFQANGMINSLQWPDDVVEQFLYDHADNANFLRDYGHIDLSRLSWGVEIVSTLEFCDMPTGASDGDCIEEYAENPGYWVKVRAEGIHKGVAESWEVHGTWKRWPILIHRSLLDPSEDGLQVVEGRTRVGVLRGRYRNGTFVAARHLAWVGRSPSQIVS